MHVDDLIGAHPVLYHLASRAAWPSIQRHGLLSTAALIDLFGVVADERAEMLEQVRQKSVPLAHPTHGHAIVRDQAPLKFIDRCLTEGATLPDFLSALNSRVYFWPTEDRLKRLLRARQYRDGEHVVLHVDTASLISVHGAAVELSPYNTGSVHVPNAPLRGPETFRTVSAYPYDEWRRKRGAGGDAVAEVTVLDAVPDLKEHLIQVEAWSSGMPAGMLPFES
ncbi:hypothetical protein [Terrabacter sp. MAHUQ-38]|uniref:DUF7002 family protein n=1 Tax=unclassified Terrabacter TaxID=2630222 RepID=UPI00165E37D6|nr:hypothetical protein [Terrabacter sp. MAHUQ-38]MBC9820099.1 hypothetical protein [Terrabacter sp. MAHUQ-38]